MDKCKELLIFLLLAACCQGAAARDCSSFKAAPVTLDKDVADLVDKALNAIKSRNPRGLFSISGNKLLLLRRSVSNDDDARSGDVRLTLWPRDIDSHLRIHVGTEIFSDLTTPNLFDSLSADNAIAVQREVCEGARSCDDQLPASDEVPFMLNDLLQCGHSGRGIFAFADGVLAIDMRIFPDKIVEGRPVSDKLPVGAALFFSKGKKQRYRLSALIIQG